MMLRLATGEVSPSVSVDGPRLSTASSLSSLVPDGLSRKCLMYDKLPEEPIKLYIHKLDGSYFEIEVSKTATVGDLKKAIEATFCHMPGKISWPHVWGHFCLSFGGQKLLTDTDCIKKLYIKDGDQLQFIRHIASSYKKRPKRRDSFSIEPDESLSPSNSCRDGEQELHDYDNNNDDGLDEQDEFRFVHCCWGSSCVPKRKSRQFSARFDCGFLCSFRRLLQFCEGKHYTETDALRDDTRMDVWRRDD